VTHTLRIAVGGVEAALPVLVRGIPGTDLEDATSPYGYPGATVRGPEGGHIDPGAADWSRTGLVSLFVRDRLGQPSLSGGTNRSIVQVHDPSRERGLRSRFAEQIRRNERLGYRVEALAGPETSTEHRASFHALYTETMERAEAADRYFFELEYFDRILRFERSWLLLARSPESGAAAGAIAAGSDGLIHYYLGGTASAHLADSPFKNVVARMTELADELGLPLNLGGGVRPGDGLEDFKRGFANSELPFYTHEVVCDRDAYDRLSEGREDTGFFPLYRTPYGFVGNEPGRP
jgi:hypothetical protein